MGQGRAGLDQGWEKVRVQGCGVGRGCCPVGRSVVTLRAGDTKGRDVRFGGQARRCDDGPSCLRSPGACCGVGSHARNGGQNIRCHIRMQSYVEKHASIRILAASCLLATVATAPNNAHAGAPLARRWGVSARGTNTQNSGGPGEGYGPRVDCHSGACNVVWWGDGMVLTRVGWGWIQ